MLPCSWPVTALASHTVNATTTTTVFSTAALRSSCESCRRMSYADALGRFAALWAEARVLNPEIGQDWLRISRRIWPSLARSMASHQAADFSQLIAALARELTLRHVGFMLIGGQAVLLHGAPRLTKDID